MAKRIKKQKNVAKIFARLLGKPVTAITTLNWDISRDKDYMHKVDVLSWKKGTGYGKRAIAEKFLLR
ncbi:MAG: hypothetical protein QXI68_03925 [Sulfolobales archaeon]